MNLDPSKGMFVGTSSMIHDGTPGAGGSTNKNSDKQSFSDEILYICKILNVDP